MPFRERMRRAFGRSNTSDDLTPKRSKSQQADLYKPGEVMPKPKYPGRYNKPHQDMLSAFSFGEAFRRRKSDMTDVSPMGSRMPSRKNSEAMGRKSSAHRRSHIGKVVESVDDDDDKSQVGPSSSDPPSDRDFDVQDPLKVAQNKDTFPSDALFTEEELNSALHKTSLQVPSVMTTS
ncbi:MAG: hypothetical protein M1833_002047 [Piccolia ochrophora]|nr:MAG: hypothetical protein M1833_002047 [Piccolia ochrophora]